MALRIIVIGILVSGLGSLALAGPRLVFVTAEREYGTGDTLPAFYVSELKPRGFEATFLSAPTEGPGRHDFEGLAEALENADAVVLSVRRRAPAAEDLEALRKALHRGVPLIAIRTSSHAFHLRGAGPPPGHATWERFDPEVLGGNYRGHLGNEVAQITPAEGRRGSPLLEGVDLVSTTKLYLTSPLEPGTAPLLMATVEGQEAEPVAWTRELGPRKARVFYTSLGSRADFKQPGFRRLLQNAIDWALGREESPEFDGDP